MVTGNKGPKLYNMCNDQTFYMFVLVGYSVAGLRIVAVVRSGRMWVQGSHQKFQTKFPDFSLTSKVISRTILSTTDCRSISYVNILDKSQ